MDKIDRQSNVNWKVAAIFGLVLTIALMISETFVSLGSLFFPRPLSLHLGGIFDYVTIFLPVVFFVIVMWQAKFGSFLGRVLLGIGFLVCGYATAFVIKWAFLGLALKLGLSI